MQQGCSAASHIVGRELGLPVAAWQRLWRSLQLRSHVCRPQLQPQPHHPLHHLPQLRQWWHVAPLLHLYRSCHHNERAAPCVGQGTGVIDSAFSRASATAAGGEGGGAIIDARLILFCSLRCFWSGTFCAVLFYSVLPPTSTRFWFRLCRLGLLSVSGWRPFSRRHAAASSECRVLLRLVS